MPIYMSGYVDWYLVQIQDQPKFGGLIGVTHTTVTMKLRIEKRDLLDDDVMVMLTLFGPKYLTDIYLKVGVVHSRLAGITAIPADLQGAA
jgi:hypothetical protein